jgi:hypothetical protein
LGLAVQSCKAVMRSLIAHLTRTHFVSVRASAGTAMFRPFLNCELQERG